MVAVFKFLLDGDAFAVHINAVLTAKIAHGDIGGFRKERAVVTTNELAPRFKLAVFRASYHKLRACDRNNHAGAGTADNLEFNFHLKSS